MADKETKKAEGEAAVTKVISAMSESDQAIAKKLHSIITKTAPELIPRTWYGMPAYSNGDKIVCFFRDTKKFGERFMTLGFNDVAKLDEGNMWPIYFAITKLTATEESRVAELVKKAVG